MWNWIFGKEEDNIGITAYEVSLKVHTLESRLKDMEKKYDKIKTENEELKHEIKRLRENDIYLYEEIKNFKDKYLIKIG